MSDPLTGARISSRVVAGWLAPKGVRAERRMMAVLLGLLLAMFWPTLVSLPATWVGTSQEHGFLVGALVVWLIWRDRRRCLEEVGRPVPDVMPVLALLSMAWMMAVIMNVRVVHQALAGLLFVGWGAVALGWDQRRRLLAVGATYLLGVPLWSALVPILQRATVIASGSAVKMVGISAVVGHDYVSISSGTFLVEAGCAGINYFMGGLVLGAFYAHLFAERWQTQLKIVGAAGAMAIVGNWIRVAVLIVLGEMTAMQSPYIEDHLWQGWLIFTILMVPMYAIARRIEVRDRAESLARAADHRLVYTPPPQEPSPFARERPVDAGLVRRAALAALAVSTGPILYMAVGSFPRGGAVDSGPEPLGLVSPWAASVVDPSTQAWTPPFEGADERVAWAIRGGDGVVLDAARAYFVAQRQGHELIQHGNEIAPDSLVVSDRLLGPVGASGRFVREALVRDGDFGRVIWYWYRVAGFDTPFPSKAKLLEVLSFFRRSSAAELITLTAPCDAESCLRAAQALRAATGGPAIPPPPEPRASPEPRAETAVPDGAASLPADRAPSI